MSVNPEGLYYEPLPLGLYLDVPTALPQDVVLPPLFEEFPNSPLDPCGFLFDNSEIDALGAY